MERKARLPNCPWCWK